MAEWFVEGMIERLLDRADPVARRLLDAAVGHLAPNINPDGSVRGNRRTNAADKYREQARQLASKWVGNTYGCLSLTLEMPFKNNANLPDAEVGWNGELSRKLGAGMLGPLCGCVTTR